MKFLALALVLAAAPAFADGFDVNKASHTTTNDTLKQLQNNGRNAIGLVGVVVSSATTGGLLTIYDSRGAASSKLTAVSLSSVGNYSFEVRVSSGLTYSTTGNSGGVTVIYR